jgi:hypothetical protein
MAVIRLTPEQWQAIQTIWEYDPDEPSYNAASLRASEKFKFLAPGKTTIESRAKKQGWKRRGSLNGINFSAQKKADERRFRTVNHRFRTVKRFKIRTGPIPNWPRPPGLSRRQAVRSRRASRKWLKVGSGSQFDFAVSSWAHPIFVVLNNKLVEGFITHGFGSL